MRKFLKTNRLFLGALLCLAIFLQWKLARFSPNSIQIPLLASEDPSQNLSSFEWPSHFSYLGRGKQAFAFESEDKKYVIKFFDRNRMELPWYHVFATQKWVNRRQTKQRLYPISYRLAYRQMKEETDLLYVHLGAAQDALPVITVTDPLLRTFQIDLNKTPFILQKKASDSFFERLHLSKENHQEIYSWIDQYIAINEKRIGLSIANKDKHIKDNYRCEKDRLIYIDPGRYCYDDKLADFETLQGEWKKGTYELRNWLKTHANYSLSYFDKSLDLACERTKERLCR